MPHFTEAKTPPGHEEPTSKSEQEEIESMGGPEGTSLERDREETKTAPEYETIKPRPDLNEIFKFHAGYRNPPRNRWFTKGTSGNPGGRPRGSKNKPKILTDKNFNEIFRSVFYREMKSKGGQTVSVAEAVTQRLADLALGGNLRAIQLASTHLRAVDAADAAQQEAEYIYAVEYIASLQGDPTRLLYDGLNPANRPMPIPHPKDIILDHINKKALFTGPRNEEEMIKKLSGEDFREETTDEDYDEGRSGGIADEAPEEKCCEPLPYTREAGDPPHTGDDERLPRFNPGDETTSAVNVSNL